MRWRAVGVALACGGLLAGAGAVPTSAAPVLRALYGNYVTDVRSDAPDSFDMTTGWIEVDPNTAEARVDYWLHNADKPFPTTSALVAYLVARVGTDDGTRCVPTAEIVVSTGSNESLVREPGADMWPDPSDGRSTYIDPPGTASSPLLQDIVADCFAWRVYDQATGQLRDRVARKGFLQQDPYAATFTLRDFPRMRVPIDQEVSRSVLIEHRNWFNIPRLYDRTVQVEPGAGVDVGSFDPSLGNEELLDQTGLYTSAQVPVTVTEEGEHTIHVTVTTAQGISAGQTYRFFVPYTPPDWTGSLAGRHVFEPPDSAAPYYTRVASVWFLDDAWAWFGQPGEPPDCSAADPGVTNVKQGCVPYWYDEGSGQVQVGDWRGAVFPDHIVFDGFDYTMRAVQPTADLRLGLKVSNMHGYWCRTLLGNFCNSTTTLALRKDGSYSYRDVVVDAGERVTRVSKDGHYRFTAAGLLKLRAGGELWDASLVSLGADPLTGVVAPASLGLLWLGAAHNDVHAVPRYFAPVA